MTATQQSNSDLIRSICILLSALIIGIITFKTQVINLAYLLEIMKTSFDMLLAPALSITQFSREVSPTLSKYYSLVLKAGILVFPFEIIIIDLLYFFKRDWLPTNISYLQLPFKLWMLLLGIPSVLIYSYYIVSFILLNISDI